MLELVLCSGRDGVQDPGFFLLESRLLFFGLLWFVTWLIDWMAATIPESAYWSFLDGCVHASDLDYCVLYHGWLSPYHISCIWDISCICLRRFSDDNFFSWAHSRKAFHPSLSLGPHALRVICYTAICHRPYHSPSCTLEASFHDLWKETRLANTFIASLWRWASTSLKTSPCKNP